MLHDNVSNIHSVSMQKQQRSSSKYEKRRHARDGANEPSPSTKTRSQSNN